MNSAPKKEPSDASKAIAGRRTLIGPSAGPSSRAGTLGRYITDSGTKLKNEANRAFYYSVGAGLLFTLIAIPLAPVFLIPPSTWIVCLPGVLVIVLAFLRERPQRKRLDRHVTAGSPEDLQPATEPEQCTPRKATLLGQIAETKDFEIAMYWGYRPAAHEDISAVIRNARSDIFIAGIALSTITTTLNQPGTLQALAASLRTNPAFTITVLFSDRPHPGRAQEGGGEGIIDNIRRAKRDLAHFHKELLSRMPSDFKRTLVTFRIYDTSTVPRHFILKVDGTIYAGSYLSHVRGQYSYLIKLQDYGEGVYKLFNDEIDYLKQHSAEVDIHSKA